MKLSHFEFTLPEKLVAQHPTPRRDDSRLMVVNRAKKKITHHKFSDLLSFFSKEDVIVLNDTKVFPGQLHGYKEKTEADVVITLLRELDAENRLWDVRVEPSRKIRVGNKICIGEDLVLEIIDNTTSSCRTVKFCFQESNEKLHQILHRIGHPPLPPLIKREPEAIDKERYQTVYAKKIGSVVAPSAGFHFTRLLLKSLELKGIQIADITLHLGQYANRVLNTEDLVKCKIESTPFFIPQEAAAKVNAAISKKGKKVCAVGTSTLKALESSISADQNLRAQDGWTSMFINPPYNPQIVDALLTNLHEPKTVPFIEVLGFGGHQIIMKAYEEAKKQGYRFSAYGDAMLIY